MNYGRKVNFCCLIGMPYNVQININKSDYRCADAWLPMIVCECVCVVSCPLECTLQDLIDSNSIRLCSCCFKRNNKMELKTMRASDCNGTSIGDGGVDGTINIQIMSKKRESKRKWARAQPKMNEWMNEMIAIHTNTWLLLLPFIVTFD